MAKTLISTPLDITTSDTAVTVVDITSGIDDTYSVYEFHFINIHLETLDAELQFQVNATDGTGFNDSYFTTSFFGAYNDESGGTPDVAYHAGHDIAYAKDTFQNLTYNQGAASGFDDSSMSGILTLYNPSSTTYVKHFLARTNGMMSNPSSVDNFASGYVHDATAIDEIRFQSSDGDIHAGTIKMFGVS